MKSWKKRGGVLHEELTREGIKKKKVQEAEVAESQKSEDLTELREQLADVAESEQVEVLTDKAEVKTSTPKAEKRGKKMNEDEEYHSKGFFGKLKIEAKDNWGQLQEMAENSGVANFFRSEGSANTNNDTNASVLENIGKTVKGYGDKVANSEAVDETGKGLQEIGRAFTKGFWNEAADGVKEWWDENATWKVWKWFERDRAKKK